MYKSVFWINRRTSSFVQWSPRVLGCGFREQEHDANNSGANWEHSKLAFHHQVRCYTCCWVLSVGSAVGMLSMWNLCCRLLDQWRQWTCYQCPGARVTFFAGENGEESGPVVAIFLLQPRCYHMWSASIFSIWIPAPFPGERCCFNSSRCLWNSRGGCRKVLKISKVEYESENKNKLNKTWRDERKNNLVKSNLCWFKTNSSI